MAGHAWLLAPMPAGKHWVRPFLLGTGCPEASFREVGKVGPSLLPPSPGQGRVGGAQIILGLPLTLPLSEGVAKWPSEISPWLHSAACVSADPSHCGLSGLTDLQSSTWISAFLGPGLVRTLGVSAGPFTGCGHQGWPRFQSTPRRPLFHWEAGLLLCAHLPPLHPLFHPPGLDTAPRPSS